MTAITPLAGLRCRPPRNNAWRLAGRGPARRPSLTRPPDTGCERGHGSGATDIAAAACPTERPQQLVARLPADRAADPARVRGARQQIQPDAGGVARRQRIDRGVQRFVGLARRQYPNAIRPAFLVARLHGFCCQLREISFIERAADREMDVARPPACRSAAGYKSRPWRYRRPPCRSARRFGSGWRDASRPYASLPGPFQQISGTKGALSCFRASVWLP
jgi:hypothetical protein